MHPAPHSLDPATQPQATVAVAAPAASPTVPLLQPSPAEPFVSGGHIVHREVTYRGVDWLLNSSVGVGFGVWSARHPVGKKYFSEPVQKFFKTVLSPLLKQPESLESGAKWGQSFVSIMFGGTLMMPLIMLLEKKENKKAIIKTIDETIYGKEVVAQDPKFQASYDAIDHEAQKGFFAGNAARFAALTPLITMTVTPKINNVMREHFYDRIANASKWGAKKLGITPKGFMQEGEMVEGKFQSNWDYMHEQIGFDFGLTIIYSVLHEVAYKGVAQFFSDRKERKAEEKAMQQQGHSLLTPRPVKALGTAPSALQDPSPTTEIRQVTHHDLVDARPLAMEVV